MGKRIIKAAVVLGAAAGLLALLFFSVKTKRLQIDKSEKLREKKREERKARNHRLIQMGAVIESVLGRPITDEDIPRLLDLLRFLEDEDDHYFSEAMNGVFDYRSAK